MELQVKSPTALHAAMEAAGFQRARRGKSYRHHGLTVTSDDRWLTVRAKVDPGHDPCQLGQPALWKTVVSGDQRVRREFHVPLALVEGGDAWADAADDDLAEGRNPLEACLDWAACTAGGEVPPGWTSPPREQVEEWLPAGKLAIQSGPLLRQGALEYASNRLGLAMPIAPAAPAAPAVSAELSPARRELLRRVLVDAQNRWRMVRVGMESGQDRPVVRAEVDFRGAPHFLLEGLFRVGLDALRWVVSWSLWSVALLSDAGVTCRAWEAGFEKEDVC